MRKINKTRNISLNDLSYRLNDILSRLNEIFIFLITSKFSFFILCSD